MNIVMAVLRKRCLAAAAVVVVATGSGFAADRVVDANLVVNPSFEVVPADRSLPADWAADRQIYSVDRQTARTGNASLKFVNQDPGRYRLAGQKISLRAGWKYRIGVWVKTDQLAGEESGATVCVEWRDNHGKWLGGMYPAGVKGTSDWTRIEGIARLPKEAGDCTLSCYVRQGMTGTAWFDDVEVMRLADPPLESMLLSPVYRGRITAEGPDRVRLHVGLNLVDYDWVPGSLSVASKLADSSGRNVDWQGRPAAVSSPQAGIFADRTATVLEFAAAGLPVGQYTLTVRLLSPDAKELQSASHRIERMPDGFQPTCTIDESRRLLVGGKPFFPLGMYFSTIKEDDLKTFADSKFNCLMAYGSPRRDQMDLAERYGVKVIYSIKDWYFGAKYCPPDIKSIADEEGKIRRRVGEFRDHPALLAWYLNDELPQSYMEQLNAHRRFVEAEDPHHPTWVVLYQYREVRDYVESFDVIGTDPYPVGRAAASGAAQWTAETFRQVLGARPLWQVPQVFNWANYHKGSSKPDQHRTPTFDEMRSMTWQCIAEGANGLVFYSWYDIHRNADVPFAAQWDKLKRIAAEVDRWSPVLLSVEPVPAVSFAGESPQGGPPEWLHAIVRRYQGRLYLFAVNDGDGDGMFQCVLPQSPKSVKEAGESRAVKRNGIGFEDSLKRLELRVYEIEP
ncbi:MAG: hypothetical protein GXY83_09255 [Rhodopirellula sp.]|nr:hypothetical protein [Rhodopirellula sp.]